MICNKGKKKDKRRQAEINKFTLEEQKKVAIVFHPDNDLASVGQDDISSKWGDFMMDSLKTTWMKYLFNDSNTMDVLRFTYLYKGQTQLFMDLRAMAMFRVIQQLDPLAPVTSSIDINTLKEYSEGVISSYLRCLGSFENEEFMKWSKLQARASNRQLIAFNDFIFESLKLNSFKVEVSDLEMWLRINRTFVELITGLLDVCFGFHDVGISPSILPYPKAHWPTVLDVSHVLFLRSQLTKQSTKRWRLRFHNGGNGNNYTMLSNLILNVGPTIIVIRDHCGYIFGCFASESWKQSSIFYGDIRSFMFQLKPNLIKYEASGYNYNFQYHNQHQHSMPNGFGMGGQLYFWGLWIDSDFGNGTCSDFCSTFSNYERPSSSENFTYDHIEVWSVHEDEGVTTSFQTAFDQQRMSRATIAGSVPGDPEDKAVLRMAGKDVGSDHQGSQ